jgi:hypothetical protein
MQISKIIIPVRPQPDTIIAIYLLKRFGQEKFSGIGNAQVVVDPNAGKIGNDENQKLENLLIDNGGGAYDHHGRKPETCASFLVAKDLGISGDPALSKLIHYAERDDKFGLGTISKDQLDRTFGLSGMIGALNKQFPHDVEKVINIITPLIESHHNEEIIKIHELPALYKTLVLEGKTIELNYQGLKIILLESDNISLPGYLRAQTGGNYDIVVQRRSSGHVNILSRTKKQKKIPLERLIAVIRGAEYYMHNGKEINKKYLDLIVPARISEVPNWYYDQATNSIQNGGVHIDLTPATEIPWDHFPKILELAFNEKPNAK